MTVTRRALVGARLGELSHYTLETLPLPEPKPTEVRVRVRAVALGYADGLIATGRYQVRPPTPFIPGCEWCGVIDAIGSAVTTIKVGERVCGHALGGALTEVLCVEASAVAPAPEGLTDAEAAAFWVDHLTAWHAYQDRANLQAGESVLVLGAAGALGRVAVQQARLLGATVIAAASTEAKRQTAQSEGAHHTLDYTDPQWARALQGLVGERGVDVIFDPVGGDVFEPAFRRLAWRGRHLVVGFAAGAIPTLPANLPLLKGASLVGVFLLPFMQKEPQRTREHVATLAGLAKSRQLRAVTGPSYAFEQSRDALAACFDRTRSGKVIVNLNEHT